MAEAGGGMRIGGTAHATVERRADDLTAILDLAEELRAKCEKGAERIERLRVYQGLAFASVVGGCMLYFASPMWRTTAAEGITYLYIIVFFVGFALATVYYFLFQRMITRIQRRMLPDQRALVALVRLLRETEPTLAEEKGWTPLERARFRIQLSRFEIGDPAESESTMIRWNNRRRVVEVTTKPPVIGSEYISKPAP